MYPADENDFAEAKQMGFELNEETGTVFDDEALRIAAAWSSPGTVGSVLASIASGVARTREEIVDDIAAVSRDTRAWADRGSEFDLLMLERWAEYAESPLLLGEKS